MEFIKIPHLEIQASRVALGTWSIGGWLWGGIDDKASKKTIELALDHGINIIDSAPLYGFGHAEELIGQVLQERKARDSVILATKSGINFTQEQGKLYADSRKESIAAELEASLKRLKVDCIDIFQIHWPDPVTPFHETAEILLKLKNSGKIKCIGVCNYVIDQLQELQQYAHIDTCQFPFNLFERDFKDEVLPYCQQHHLTTFGYGPLCRGLLSSKLTKDSHFEGDDLRNVDPKFTQPSFSDYLDTVAALGDWVRRKHQKTIVALAIRWSLDNGIDVALLGARKPEQLKELPTVWGWKLNSQDFQEIDTIIHDHLHQPAKAFFAIGERPPGLLLR